MLSLCKQFSGAKVRKKFDLANYSAKKLQKATYFNDLTPLVGLTTAVNRGLTAQLYSLSRGVELNVVAVEQTLDVSRGNHLLGGEMHQARCVDKGDAIGQR